ncbi:uncharacterized protein METZ01_LOCUS125778 [marine metagenome]|uniref:Uncharacterized protein n=1 Tax=marine metagenome TaxID=408172 RepID=A0A381Y7C5_9ZZZZ
MIEVEDLWLQAQAWYAGWIPWKNVKLTEIEYYDPNIPYPKRMHTTKLAPPRLILREPDHQNPYVPARPDFPSPGHLEFKVWIQNKIEEVSRGGGSARFLYGQKRGDEREKAMTKWEQLATNRNKGIRLFLDKELFNDPRIAEARHLQLMQKILGRKGPFGSSTTQRAEELDPDFTFPKQTRDSFGLIDQICLALVRIMISKSRTTYPSDEDVYWHMVDSGNDDKVMKFAKGKGIVFTTGDITKYIQGNPKFFTRGKHDTKKYEK